MFLSRGAKSHFMSENAQSTIHLVQRLLKKLRQASGVKG